MPSNAYFYNHIEPLGQWQFTQIEVGKSFTPYYRLLTCGKKQRFLLASDKSSKNPNDNPNHGHTLYWGRVSADYYDIFFLRHNQPLAREFMPVRPITSSDIETFKQANPANPNQYWADFYAQALIASPTTILHQGQWRITTGVTEKIDRYAPIDWWQDCDYQFEYHNEPTACFMWEDHHNNPFPLKPPPKADDGRVKWWRKKIRENACPPILLWWQRNLLNHIVIDGHSRWLAYQLENKKPEVLVISAFKTTNYPYIDDPKKRLQVLRSLKQYVSNQKNEKLINIKHINDILIKTYHINTPEHDAVTVGKPIKDLDERWEREVKALLSYINPNDGFKKGDLEYFLK